MAVIPILKPKSPHIHLVAARLPSTEFELIHELEYNREQYTISSRDDSRSLSILSFPSIVNINIERVGPVVSKGSRPGISVICAACIAGGLEEINNSTHLDELADLRAKFDSAPVDTDGDIVSLMGAWFTGLVPELPAGERRNIHLPMDIHSALAACSSAYGISQYMLAVIAIMDTLSSQKFCITSHATDMRNYLNKFHRTIKLRVIGIRALMCGYKIGTEDC